MQRLIKTVASVKGEIVSQDEVKTVLRIPVSRFGSPESKDLHDEYFKKDCYFGDDTIKTKFGLYEHLMNPEHNPYAPKSVQAQVLGPATLVKTDDMARWFDFEIMRANQYHDYVIALNEKGWLGTSTQCFPYGKDADSDGGIKTWLESEVTLTPTPADQHLIPELAALAKSFGLPEPEVLTDPPAADIKSEEQPAADPPAPEPAPAAEETDEIEEILKNATAPAATDEPVEKKTVEVPTDILQELLTTVKSTREELAAVKAYVWGDVSIHGMPQEGETLFDVLKEIQELVGSANSTATKTQKGLTTLAKFIAAELRKEVREVLDASEDEKEADELLGKARGHQYNGAKSSSIPDHAPGG